MDLGGVIVFMFFQFFIILGAVRLAIAPIVDKDTDIHIKSSLSSMHEMGVLKYKEYKEIKKKLINKEQVKNNQNKLDKYSNVLLVLKEQGIITDKDFEIKTSKLKDYFNNV